MTHVVALFAGPGGSCLGAHTNGLRPLGIEWDDAAVATRRAAGLPTLQADVAKLDPAEVMREHFGQRVAQERDSGPGAEREPRPLAAPSCTIRANGSGMAPTGTGWVVTCPPLTGLIATPPCQAFSMAGKGKGRDHVPAIVECMNELMRGEDTRAKHDAECDDDRAMLVVEPLRWALALKPRWIALEQVPPVLAIWQTMGEHLRTLGYWVWTGVLSAEQYGVPQTRRRAFLIASLDGPVQPPAPTHQEYKPGEPATGTPDTLMGPGLLPWVSMADALGWGMTVRLALTTSAGTGGGGGADPAMVGGSGARRVLTAAQSQGEWKMRSNSQTNAATRGVDEPAPTLTAGHDAAERVWEPPTHYDARQTGFRPRPVEEPAPTIQAQGLAKGRDVWTDDADTTYTREDADARHREAVEDWTTERPSPTVVGTRRSDEGMLIGRSLPEGEGRNVGGKNWGEKRTEAAGVAVRVSVREAAVLQGFPPDHPWQGSRTAQYRQIGDAVPPPLMAAVIGAAIAPTFPEAVAA